MDWVWDLWRSNSLIALGLVLFIGGLGVPSPAALAIVATGALVRNGGAPLIPALIVGVIAATAGDFVSYELARRGLGRWLEKKKKRPAWAKAVARFESNAWMTLFLSRWLLTPLGLATAYLAGSNRYPRSLFLSASLLGHLIWIGAYGGIGYLFADHWQTAAGTAKQYAGYIAGIIIIGAIVAFVLRKRRKPLPA